MGKQAFNKIKKTLGILLLFLFIVSLTVEAISANRDHFDPSWGQNTISAYEKEYNMSTGNGAIVGMYDGISDGDLDCRHGLDDAPDSSKYHKTTTSKSAQSLGKIDGFNDGFDKWYDHFYDNAYKQCVNSGKINTQFVKNQNP
jgi:hypothetical protein